MYYSAYTQEAFDTIADRLYEAVFPNDEIDFQKSVWRMSQGCREAAYHVVKTYGNHYNIYVDDELFDYVCGMANGGIEVEWLTEKFEDEIDNDQWNNYYQRRIAEKRQEVIDIDKHFGIKQ